MLAKGNKNKFKMANTNFEIWFEIAAYGNWKKQGNERFDLSSN